MPVSFDRHRAQIVAILEGWGMPPANAATAADGIAWADFRGVKSHGIAKLPGYGVGAGARIRCREIYPPELPSRGEAMRGRLSTDPIPTRGSPRAAWRGVRWRRSRPSIS